MQQQQLSELTAKYFIIPPSKSANPFSMDQLSPLATTICYILSAFHIGINAICLPISAINFLMIMPTAILHRNLKFLLLLQVN
jgi:hypothetical protein